MAFGKLSREDEFLAKSIRQAQEAGEDQRQDAVTQGAAQLRAKAAKNQQANELASHAQEPTQEVWPGTGDYFKFRRSNPAGQALGNMLREYSAEHESDADPWSELSKVEDLLHKPSRVQVFSRINGRLTKEPASSWARRLLELRTQAQAWERAVELENQAAIQRGESNHDLKQAQETKNKREKAHVAQLRHGFRDNGSPLTNRSSNKYHITPEGKVARCRAEVRSCPYGEAAPHFTADGTAEEVLDAAKAFAEQHNKTVVRVDMANAVATPRQLVEEVHKKEKELGRPLDELELSVSLEAPSYLQDKSSYLLLERKVEGGEEPYTSRAYWRLSPKGSKDPDEVENFRDEISREDIVRYVTRRGAKLSLIHEGGHLSQELCDDMADRALEVMRATEREAARAPVGRATTSVVKINGDDEELALQGDRIRGGVNYGGSAFSPGQLEGAAFGEGAQLGLFTTRETGIGGGASSWKISKLRKQSGEYYWLMEMRGARGETVWKELSHETGETDGLLYEAYNKHFLGEIKPLAFTERADYIGDLLATDARLTAKAQAHERSKFETEEREAHQLMFSFDGAPENEAFDRVFPYFQ